MENLVIMGKERKKLKDTKIGIFLKEKAPDVLEIVKDALPEKGVIGFVKNLIDGDKEMSQPDKDEAARLLKIAEIEYQYEQEITKRWESDMQSDSWLSKNSRPMILLYSWFLITLIVILSFFGIQIPEEYTMLIQMLATAVNVAYFGSRTIEKYHSRKLK